MKKSFADILKSAQEQSEKKMFAKVPEWKDTKGLVFPTALSTEQCSSSETARYKVGVILAHSPADKPMLADLTGGLGVDSWAFSQACSMVFYNEMNEELANCVRSNYEKIGISNVSFSSREIQPGNIASVLGGFKPDVVFLDPARRSDVGKKVFMVEDCRPDILNLRDELLEIAPLVVVKLSPMADISLLAKQLGPHVSEVHVVGSAGECKELIVVMDRSGHENYSIFVAENGTMLSFAPADESAAHFVLADGDITGKILFEPGKALMKAGAFNLICRYGLKKLGRSTHLYVCDQPIEEIQNLGKWFHIDEVRDLNNRTIKELGKEYPKCEMTARNLPMTTEQLRKKMGSASGGIKHIFALHADVSNSNLLLVTENIRP